VAAPVLTTFELRAVEARYATAPHSLMARAGRAIAETARRMASDTGSPILVVAGPGNNGGDAWVAAAHLLETFHQVTVLDATGAPAKANEARAASEVVRSKGAVATEWPAGPAPALVIDGLLGIGLARDVEPPLDGLIAKMNACGAPILSIDVPSGIESATGRARGAAVRATRTLTFLAHKVGLHTGEALDHRGVVELDDLGTGPATREVAKGWLVGPEDVRGWLAPRPANSHKGHFGTLGVIGGHRGMIGAALLAGRAGVLAGAGKVRVGLLSHESPLIDAQSPELMLAAVDDALASDVLVVGPGAGQSPSATSVSMFERNVLPAAIASSKPLVLDADALNTLAYNDVLRASVPKRTAPTLMTPHPAEAGRLLGRQTAEVQSDRLAAALELARRMHAFVVLKGAGSICASPEGIWTINSTGNPGLASGGTGDVLAGVLGALLAQRLDAWRALQYAVCLHGAAADSLVARGKGPIGLTASEIALECRRLLNLWTARP
jgi:hydroxyethylthiazole kinase-like uncharacterized protein yjeF